MEVLRLHRRIGAMPTRPRIDRYGKAVIPCRNYFINPDHADFHRFLVSGTKVGNAKRRISELDQMQASYKTAVEEWMAAIKEEEALASVNHTVAEVDKWEAAHFKEDEIRNKVKAAKKKYEDALRKKFFGF